jgi:hypothetical protein
LLNQKRLLKTDKKLVDAKDSIPSYLQTRAA